VAFLLDLKASFAHRQSRFAIPVAVADYACGQRNQEILQASGKTIVRADMFEEQKRSTGLEHAADFLQTTRWIAD
jgi:hypothetical protein